MPKTLASVVILMLLVQGNSIAVVLRSPRRPQSAAESREEERESVRTVLFVVVLAAVAQAGEASWTAEMNGSGICQPPQPGTSSGNAKKLEVTAHMLGTKVDGYAHVDPFCADQDGVAEAGDTTWFSLKFTGSESAVDPSWEITTSIDGKGFAIADTELDGSAWSESVQLIKFTGDNTNVGVGQLAAHENATVKVSFSIPAGLDVTLDKSERRKGEDVFEVSEAQTSTGKGKCCRVRAKAYAKARVVASCNIGIAFASANGWLCASLKMIGYCTIGGKKIRDIFRLVPLEPGEVESKVEKPTGGLEKVPGKVPTDTPTEDERAGKFDEEPVTDAKDLEEEGGWTGTESEEEPKEAPADEPTTPEEDSDPDSSSEPSGSSSEGGG